MFGEEFARLIITALEDSHTILNDHIWELAIVAPICAAGIMYLFYHSIRTWIERRKATESNAKEISFLNDLWRIIQPITVTLAVVLLYYASAPAFEKVRAEYEIEDFFDLIDGVFFCAALVSLGWFSYRFGDFTVRMIAYYISPVKNRWIRFFMPPIAKALRIGVPSLFLLYISQYFISDNLRRLIQNNSAIFVLIVIAWLLWQSVNIVERILHHRFNINMPNNLRARSVHTQVRVLKRLLLAGIIFLTLASIMMLIPGAKRFGASLLASAGVAGVVIGLAAQKTFANVFAGIQIGLSQPIRIDDVVIVEGEWGRIEEIRLTYVVIAIWDQRRLVVPVSYFLEQPFQNWTRVTSDLLGTVFLYTDYDVPLDELRAELIRICEGVPDLWDGRVAKIDVTEAKERSLELRVLISAVNSGLAWDLRCLVREQLIEYLKQHHPHSLPRARVALSELKHDRIE